jgi:hypothetical protein
MPKDALRHAKQSERTGFLSDGKVALGIAIGLVLALVGYILFQYLVDDFSEGQVVEIAPAIVALIVAMTSTVLAGIALREQRKIREAGTDPVVIAHFGQRADARELITFDISNIGAGAAMNVNIDVEAPDDDLSKRNLLQNIFDRHHPFRVIRQGTSVSFPFALGWDLLRDKPIPPFSVKITYEDIEGTEYWTEIPLDVRELEKLGAEKSPIMRAVTALEKIAKSHK